MASEWLSTLSLPAPAVAKPGAPPLVIGGWGGPELQLVPEAVARFLERRGYPAVELRELPNRAAAVEALADGVINVLPDYSASLLEYLNGGREEASADAASTTARLGAYLDQFGARASAVSPGAAAMVFAVDAGVARASSLRRLSDLQSVAAVMKVPRVGRAAAAGPPALAVSLRAERHELELGDRGPEVAAVQARLRQLGYPVSMDGALAGATVDALHAFQAARGLPASSGVIDERTRQALERRPTQGRWAAGPTGRLSHLRRRPRPHVHTGHP